MGTSFSRWTGQDPVRQVLGMALPFLVVGTLLYLAALALGATGSESLLAVGQSLRAPAPYLLGLGLVLLAIALLIRLRQGPRRAQRPDSSQMSSQLGNTTIFGSQLDSRMGDLVDEPAGKPPRAPTPTWNAQVFRDIEWRRFEQLCGALFAQAGFEARTESNGAEGGALVWLYSEHIEGPAALVQCTHKPGKKIGLDAVRAFHDVMTAHKVLRGTFATSGTFSADAREFAKANGIVPMDRLGVLALISQRTAQQKAELLQLAYEGEYWRPTCDLCGARMVQRRARKRGRVFWGCVDYPQCDFMLPVRK